MPIYNGECHLRAAMDSILSQTFVDYEFLVINDGSTDSTVEIVKSYNDPRIRIVHNGSNLGLIRTLNLGLREARGDYIVRMDCDDISVRERLAVQYEFMEARPEIGICGSWMTKFGEGPQRRVITYAEENEELRAGLLFEPAFSHPSVIMRKRVLRDNNLVYDENCQSVEDYELWTRLQNYTKFANVQRSLLKYRIHGSQISSSLSGLQTEKTVCVQRKLLAGFSCEPTANELMAHRVLGGRCARVNHVAKDTVVSWIRRLLDMNAKTGLYDEKALKKVMIKQWIRYNRQHFEKYGMSLKSLLSMVYVKNTGINALRISEFLMKYLYAQIKYRGI